MTSKTKITGPLYRIHLGEPCSRDWCTSYSTYFHDPVKLAKRMLRLVNHWGNYPGGYDQIYSRAEVWEVGIWPEGDRWMAHVRAGRTPHEKRRRVEKRTEARA